MRENRIDTFEELTFAIFASYVALHIRVKLVLSKGANLVSGFWFLSGDLVNGCKPSNLWTTKSSIPFRLFVFSAQLSI